MEEVKVSYFFPGWKDEKDSVDFVEEFLDEVENNKTVQI